LRNNCDVIRDLIPIYVEKLTSEKSNQFIKEHIHSCIDCSNYLRSVERSIPNLDITDINADKNEQKLMEGINAE
jgi:predicted anti-sigma-YlaC factor YlaD